MKEKKAKDPKEAVKKIAKKLAESKASRKRPIIDWEKIKVLHSKKMTMLEISGIIDVSVSWIFKECKRVHKCSFDEYLGGQKTGATRMEVDWDKVDKLLLIQCNMDEVSSVLGMSHDVLYARCKEQKGITFQEYMDDKKLVGKVSLRRTQWRHAESNPAMAIFLGKNILGQSDKVEQDITSNGKEIANLTSQERQEKIAQLQGAINVTNS